MKYTVKDRYGNILYQTNSYPAAMTYKISHHRMDWTINQVMKETIVQGIIMSALCWIATALFLCAGKFVPPPIILGDVIFTGMTLVLIFKKHG